MMPECFPGIDRGCDFMRDETVIEQNAIVTAIAVTTVVHTLCECSSCLTLRCRSLMYCSVSI